MNKNELQSLLKSINEAHVQSLSEMDQPPMYGAGVGQPRPLMKDLLNDPQYAGQGRSQLQAHPAFAAYHHEHADHFKDIADNLNAFGYYGGDSGHDHEFHMQGLNKHFKNDHESLRDNLVAAAKAHLMTDHTGNLHLDHEEAVKNGHHQGDVDSFAEALANDAVTHQDEDVGNTTFNQNAAQAYDDRRRQ
jgi:hypothetical protein